MALSRCHLRDQGAHFVLLVGVETVGRLVQHQHRRIMQQRLRQADAALESLGQRLDRLQPHAFQPCQMHGASIRSDRSLPPNTAYPGEEAEEGLDCHFRIGRRAFRQEAQHPPRLHSGVLHIVAANAARCQPWGS